MIKRISTNREKNNDMIKRNREKKNDDSKIENLYPEIAH